MNWLSELPKGENPETVYVVYLPSYKSPLKEEQAYITTASFKELTIYANRRVTHEEPWRWMKAEEFENELAVRVIQNAISPRYPE